MHEGEREAWLSNWAVTRDDRHAGSSLAGPDVDSSPVVLEKCGSHHVIRIFTERTSVSVDHWLDASPLQSSPFRGTATRPLPLPSAHFVFVPDNTHARTRLPSRLSRLQYTRNIPT